MSASSVLAPKKRQPTRDEVRAFEALLRSIVAECRPATVRQVYYQAVTRGLVDKTEQEYKRVQRALLGLRRRDLLDWEDIVDSSRWVIKPDSWSDPAAALEDAARFYRKSLWRDAAEVPEVWVEKDALTGVLQPVTAEWEVGLYAARGCASDTFIHASANKVNERASRGQRTAVYHLGDFDPSGRDAAKAICNGLARFCGEGTFSFTELALTVEQIREHDLPLRPTKKGDQASATRAKRFHETYGVAGSAELDALHPDELRKLVRGAVEQHLPADQLEQLRLIEDEERRGLEAIAIAAREEGL